MSVCHFQNCKEQKKLKEKKQQGYNKIIIITKQHVI